MLAVRVMLVEDNLAVLNSIHSLLKRMPELSVVATARDGAEALPLIQESQPQVLILDINMPKMNGWELLDELRKMSSPVKVIVLSVQQDDVLKQRALEQGAVAYVSKDDAQFFLGTLQRVIASYMRN